MANNSKSPHRLAHVELISSGARTLGSMGKGDVFVRHGAPHIRVEVQEEISPRTGVPIVNLQNGSMWWAAAADEVWPAMDVTLEFRTSHRGD